MKWLFWRRRRSPLVAVEPPSRAALAAWQAELTAYAALRVGQPLRITFGLRLDLGWGDTLVLPRPDGRLDEREALRHATALLDHLLAHYRHSWREVALLLHTWAHPGERIYLPWKPWATVGLEPAAVLRTLREVCPELWCPEVAAALGAGLPQRQRSAVIWLYAALTDARDRALEVAALPGLAAAVSPPWTPGERLPRRPWERVLLALAADTDEATAVARLSDQVAAAVMCAREAALSNPGEAGWAPLAVAVAVGQRLSAARVIPPAHAQAVSWLTPAWGHWQRRAQLEAAIARLAQTPGALDRTSALALLQSHSRRPPGPARGMALRSDADPFLPDLATSDRHDGTGARHPVEAEAPALQAGDPAVGSVPREPGSGDESEPLAGEVETIGGLGAAVKSAGPGVLGALRVVVPTDEDRLAYWELRAALTPEIRRLADYLRQTGEQYIERAPRRFQRQGRLDRRRIPAAVTGRDTVFKQHLPRPLPKHSLCLLLDRSASMGNLAKYQRDAAIVLEAAASEVGARVSAFTFGAKFERLESPAVSGPLLALGRRPRVQGGTPFGPAVAAVAAWHATQLADYRHLWVLTDGRWSARDHKPENWHPDLLQDVIVWVLGPVPPPAPVRELRILAAPTLPTLIDQARHYYWAPPHLPPSDLPPPSR